MAKSQFCLHIGNIVFLLARLSYSWPGREGTCHLVPPSNTTTIGSSHRAPTSTSWGAQQYRLDRFLAKLQKKCAYGCRCLRISRERWAVSTFRRWSGRCQSKTQQIFEHKLTTWSGNQHHPSPPLHSVPWHVPYVLIWVVQASKMSFYAIRVVWPEREQSRYVVWTPSDSHHTADILQWMLLLFFVRFYQLHWQSLDWVSAGPLFFDCVVLSRENRHQPIWVC